MVEQEPNSLVSEDRGDTAEQVVWLQLYCCTVLQVEQSGPPEPDFTLGETADSRLYRWPPFSLGLSLQFTVQKVSQQLGALLQPED